MESNFFKDLCKRENALVEKLRVLREFKTQFFTEDGADIPLDAEVKKTAQNSNSHTQNTKKAKKGKRSVSKRGGETIPQKIKNALKELPMSTGKTSEVADKLIDIYPEYKTNPVKAQKDARHYLSKLKQSLEIEVVEEGEGSTGNTYKYKDDYDIL